MAAQISVLRGIVIPAEDISSDSDFIALVEKIDLAYPDLVCLAPIDMGYTSPEDGETIMLIGAPMGREQFFGVLRLDGDREITVINRDTGDLEDALCCALSDEQIVQLLAELDFSCSVRNIATYVVCWSG